MYKYCPLFAQRGFVVSTINFRDEYKKPLDERKMYEGAYRALQDCHAALRFLIKNADEYGIDTSAVFVGGSSHGAVQSIGLAYIEQQDLDRRFPEITQSLGRFDNSTNEINTTFNIKGVLDLWGQILDTALISYEEAHNIPIIMFHGTADSSLSTYDKSVLIAERFKQSGACYQFHTKTGAGHGENMSKYYIAAKTGCFIKSILCGSCTTLEREINNQDLDCDNPLKVDIIPKKSHDIKIDTSLFAKYIGNYSFLDEGEKKKLSISNENGRLFIVANNGEVKWELFAESDKVFYTKEDNAQFTFNKGKNGEITGLTLYIDAKAINCKKKR
jgi:predicted esterase